MDNQNKTARKYGGVFHVVPAFPALFSSNTEMPSCPTCGTYKFVAALIERGSGIVKGVTCENGHGFDPMDLSKKSFDQVYQTEPFSYSATQEALRAWLIDFIQELRGSSDRVAAIISLSLMDTILTIMIRSFSIDGNIAEDNLLQVNRPLGTFSAKMNFCYLFGLISKTERDALKLLNDMRNDFAHKLEAKSFNDQKTGDRIVTLGEILLIDRKKGNDIKTREVFDRAVNVLFDKLLLKISLIKRSPVMPFEPIGPIYLAWRDAKKLGQEGS